MPLNLFGRRAIGGPKPLLVTQTNEAPSEMVPSMATNFTNLPPQSRPAVKDHWVQNLLTSTLNAATQLVTVFRAPLFTPIRQTASIAVTATVAVNLLVSTLSPAQAAPFNQRNWPNPISKPSTLNRSWANVQLREIPADAPFFKTDWPNPRIRQPSLQSWTNDAIRTVSGVPFAKNDWPNPQTPRRSTAQIYVRPGPAPATVIAPFSQDDWPNPQRRQQLTPSWTNDGIRTAPVAVPFSQDDWPNPVKAISRIQDWTLNAIRALQAPFSQADWPNPQRGFRVGQPRFEQNLLETTLARPFFQSDWPNPQTKRHSPRTFIGGVLREIAAPAPFVPFDWPNPARRLDNRRDFIRGMMPPVAAVFPFSQTQWVNPRSQRPAGVPTIYVRPGGPAAIVAAAPFTQTDWPNPKNAVYPISLRNFMTRGLTPNEIPPGAAVIVNPPHIKNIMLIHHHRRRSK